MHEITGRLGVGPRVLTDAELGAWLSVPEHAALFVQYSQQDVDKGWVHWVHVRLMSDYFEAAGIRASEVYVDNTYGLEFLTLRDAVTALKALQERTADGDPMGDLDWENDDE
jgi:hypothetical protein